MLSKGRDPKSTFLAKVEREKNDDCGGRDTVEKLNMVYNSVLT